MKYDPLPYREPTKESVGYFFASLSPDGWQDAAYQPPLDKNLISDEVREFTDLINSFIKLCKDQDMFARYLKNHGTKLDKTTVAVSYSGNLMDYVLTATGYAVKIEPFRKEN